MEPYLEAEARRFRSRVLMLLALTLLAIFVLEDPLQLTILLVVLPMAVLGLVLHHHPDAERYRALRAYDRDSRRQRGFR